MSTNKNKHFTLEERRIILMGITNGSTKVSIANTLGKEKSTVGKEIKLHRELRYKSTLPSQCSNYKQCTHHRVCTNGCPDYKKHYCKRRDRSPGACNGCEKYKSCRFDKYYYSPEDAHKEYRNDLVDSRTGVNLTLSEVQELGAIVKPLIEQGHSPYTIITNHPELGISEKTLYNYIEGGVFRCVGLQDVDLRIKTRRKLTKKVAATYKKRQDRKFLNGRTYKDYQRYMEENPNASVVEMDTVYNDVSNGPFIQTFKFLDYGFLFGMYHNAKDAEAMLQGINVLETILGTELFLKCVEVLKTDRGSEFSYADAMETKGELRRTKVFYCDPMQSGQKGSLENKHKELRYILPKKTDLRGLGLLNQATLNTVLSHVNSAPKEKLKDKTPIEMMTFLNEELMMKFKQFGIQEIEKDKVVLKPYLLKK